MTDLRIRAWSKLSFKDPYAILLAYRAVERAMATEQMPPKVARLRTAALKREREVRDAALFTYGMSKKLGVPVHFAATEDSDHDFLARIDLPGEQRFAPVQLKELVPSDLNESMTLEALLAQLRAKPVATETCLALRLNREVREDLSPARFAGLPFGEVWLFWAADPDAVRWSLFGNVLRSPTLTTYEYPTDVRTGAP